MGIFSAHGVVLQILKIITGIVSSESGRGCAGNVGASVRYYFNTMHSSRPISFEAEGDTSALRAARDLASDDPIVMIYDDSLRIAFTAPKEERRKFGYYRRHNLVDLEV